MKNVGIRAINLEDGDELISVRETDGKQMIIIATYDGMASALKKQT
jgi:DNA gyrase subunit A